jgi:hypothetical protein
LQYILESDVDTWEPPIEISANFPYYLSGFDSENRPIWVLEFGKWDIRSLVEKREDLIDDLKKHVDQWLYRMYKSTGTKATPENPVKDLIVILDTEGLDLHQVSSAPALIVLIQHIRKIASCLQFAYVAYVVNASFVAKNLINLVKPLVSRDFARVEVLGTNPSHNRQVLLRNIPSDQLAEWYGGAKDFKPVQVYG